MSTSHILNHSICPRYGIMNIIKRFLYGSSVPPTTYITPPPLTALSTLLLGNKRKKMLRIINHIHDTSIFKFNYKPLIAHETDSWVIHSILPHSLTHPRLQKPTVSMTKMATQSRTSERAPWISLRNWFLGFGLCMKDKNF